MNSNSCAGYSHQRIDIGTGGSGNKRMRKDHRNYSIVENGQTTENSSEDLRRLVGQRPVINTIMYIIINSKFVKKVS